MHCTGQTHVGLVRSNNQDILDYGVLGETMQYAVVCDGMGGANGGNIASNIAVRVIVERIKEAVQDGHLKSAAQHVLESAMAAANFEVYDRAQSDVQLDGMGTTVVAAITCGRMAYISHVGDSRLYRLHENELIPVTRDHSVVQEMVESGQLTEEEARSHPRKHCITRALGVSEMESGEYDELELTAGDRLLLCTDGLTNMVEPTLIRQIIQDNTIEDAVPALVQAALDGGGTDNITVLLLDVD